MRLSQLTIKGFKSFADETIINFGEQVIGVVGPNGSGKSNIVDSIKWVLGEGKTKELRLESMQDVIFAGTKKRKAGKVARVTLNFDNTKNILPTEYTNVSISRLLYSNGQSEYRLNDVVCRKKDITSLFLDSGMGSNAYAIISLSMVEDILVDRENSRGKMIEEASGINKFKVRKRETLNKLKGTQADLDRVEDLLYELESNLKAFEKQARRTERYLKIKEEFKLVSLSWATRSSHQLKREIEELQAKLDGDVKVEAELSSQLNQKEADLQKVKKEVLEKEGQLSDFQRSHNKLKEQISALENSKGIAQNELSFLNSGLQNAEKENENISNELEQLRIELKGKSNVISDKKAVLNNKKQEYQTILHSFNAVKETYDSIRENLVSEQREKSELRNRIEKSKREIGIKQNEIALLENQLGINKTELDQNQVLLNEISHELSNAQTDLSKAIENHENHQNKLAEIRSKISEQSAKSQSKKDEKRKIELRLDKSRQRAELLENVINNYEGFTEAIQYLNSENKINQQTISDILEIKDPKYQKVIELFFEPILQHVVVDDVDEAYKLNDIIRGAQKGKVNFYIKGESVPSSEKIGSEFIPLHYLISFHEDYSEGLNFLSNNVFVFEGSFKDLPINEMPENAQILLPNELMIYSQNELRGGSATLFEGVNIGRRKNLEDLKNQIKQLEGQDIELIKSIEEEASLINNLYSEEEEALTLLKELESIKNEAEKTKNVLQTRYTVNEKISLEAQTKNSNSIQHIANVKGELEALIKLSESFSAKSLEEDNLEELRADFEKYHADFEKSRERKDQKSQEISNDENDIKLVQRDIDQIERSINEKVNKQKEHLLTIERNNAKIGSLLKNLEKIKKDAIDLYANEKEQFEKLNSQEEAFFSAKSGIFEKEKEIFELRGKREKAQHIITNIKEKLSEKNIKLTSWKDRMEVEFNENINKYEVDAEFMDFDLDELGQRREQLQLRLKSFGDINPLAIEAYNEIQERVDKIAAERDDILSAKENLEETIRDIEETASNLFTESLDKIRAHFKDVFRSLFSEDDDCDIVLLNAENPLESSIEIIAKPKGKKPKSINQLSGGEKTLTAVSFLFALYLLKPAPFCIFDEVDAPLDDVNIQKFNNIIRTFSKDSQFIIVTHNKATMAEMDILYGVFMQETGVSGVAAVDFRDFGKIDLFNPN